MNKSMVWKLVAAAFVLNAVGLLWIRNELVNTDRSSEQGRQIHGLQVTAFEPNQRVERADRLLVVFNRDLVPDGMIGQPVGWTPFTIEPKAEGIWQWNRKNAMEYRLVRPLPEANRFSVKATERFTEKLGEPLEGNGDFFLQSSPLEVLHCEKRGRKNDRVEIELRFSSDVEPDVLAECFEAVGSNGKVLKKEVLGAGRKRVQVVAVEQPDGRSIEVSLKKGMTGVSGPLGLERAFTSKIFISPAFCSLSARTPWRLGTDEKCSVELRFNKLVDVLQERPKVTLVPEIEGLAVSWTQKGIRLYGAFESIDRHFVATVESDVHSQEGEVLPAGERFSFVMPKRYPSVAFVQNHGVLSPKGNMEVELKTCSIQNLRLSATKIYPNNLASHLRGDSRYRPQRIGRELFSTVKPVRDGGNSVCTTVINLSDWIEKPLGLYYLQVENEESRWRDDQAVVAVTDLMITTKTHPNGVTSWVTSLSSGEPVDGVKVFVLSTKNQHLAEGRTDENGLVELTAPQDHPSGAPWVVVAEKGNDLSFRRLDQRKWDLPKVAKDGRYPAVGLDGYLYAARGVRRPGELVRLTGVVRDEFGNEPDEKTPLELRAFRPDGKLAQSVPLRMDRGGVFHHDFQTPEEAWTGVWRFGLFLPGSDREIAVIKTGVEAFMPVRLEVESEPVQPWFGQTDSPEVIIASRYLFGVAAAGMPFQVRGEWKQAPLKVIGHDGFVFGDESASGKVTFQAIRSETDLDGEGLIFPSTDRLTPGFWKGEGYVSVTTPGGATVSDSFELSKFNAPRMVGVRIAKGPVLADRSFLVELVACNPLADEVPVGNVELVLEKIESDWVHKQVNGTWTWSRREDAIERSKLLVEQVEGETMSKAEMICEESGNWQLVARDLVGGALTKIRFQVSRPGSPVSVARSPHRVELSLDRESYKPGETAKVSVDSPFEGQLLLTLETDLVDWAKSIPLTEGKAQIEVPLPELMPGGAFVTASVVRPLDAKSSDWKPHRAYGMVRLATDFSPRKIELALELPSEARPGTEVEVKVGTNLSENAYVHLWAVDEGVLSVTDFNTPAPSKSFFAPWRAVVDSGDLYLELFPDHKRSSSMERFGAGGGASRRSLVKAHPPKSVILWNEFVSVGEDGLVKAKFSLPEDFTGELRFMAVAVAGNSFGSAESPLTVTTPLLAEVSLPRFVAPGDKFLSPVTLFNTSEEKLTVETVFELSGPARLLDDPVRTVALRPGESATSWFELQADRAMGQVLVSVKANGGGESALAKGAFSVRPAATLDAEYETFVMEAGEERLIESPERFLASGLKRTVTISSSPVTELVPALEELLGFPYGCVEQTTSKAMPMIYASALLDASKADFARESVLAGIKRLELMQTGSGGLAYWPGGTKPNLWGTCYATGFLMEAKTAGFEIDEGFLGGLVSYLRKALRSGEHDLNKQAFICQALAMFGKPEKSRQRYLLDKVESLDLAGLARLAGAWRASGRPDLARRCLRQEALEKEVKRTYNGRLTSDTAARATMLSVLLDIDPDHPWVGTLSERILRAKRDFGWPSTLDNGLALVSFCKLHARKASVDTDFSGSLSGAGFKGSSFSSDSTFGQSVHDTGTIKLASSGKGNVFVSVQTQGLVSPESLQPIDRGISARRRWLDADGTVLRDWNSVEGNSLELSVGDLVWVEVMLQSKGPNLHNVAVVDALPGGFAVENPRLATSAVRLPGTGETLNAGDRADRTEFLDDRVVLFASAKPDSQVFRYAIRAVASGEFLMPGIQASCMYDETQNSLGPIDSVKVAVP
ncbi:MG2 domain-containing protein [Verrucomicrobia bacterium]|nr:MG2 domain-containing protein [Verrucomicrobiota bacterium]